MSFARVFLSDRTLFSIRHTCVFPILPAIYLNQNRRAFFATSARLNEKKTMKIYTKTGDKGTSALFTGERRPKDDIIFEALGTVDELTSHLGLAREFCEEANNGLTEYIETIQSLLQDVSSNIATPREDASAPRLARTEFDVHGTHTANLESWIDALSAQLPPLKNFILPSGGRSASQLHIARAVCRRAERRVAPLVASGSSDNSVGIFINRLSDWLYEAARFAANKEGRAEIIYKKPKEAD